MESSEDDHSTSDPKRVYGILGLGPVSQLILKQILSNETYRCIVWDIELLRGNKKISQKGAIIANTPEEVVRNSSITFSFVDFDVKVMIDGIDGVLPAINHTKGYVEMSQIDLVSSKEICSKIEGKNGRYLEAQTIHFTALSGKAKGISIMAGNHSLFEECVPLFESTSSDVYYLGSAVGIASLEKTFVTSLCNTLTTAMGETFRIAQQAGLDIETFAEISKKCLKRQIKTATELIVKKNDIPLQTMSQMVKEQQNMQREASNYYVSMPITATTTQSLLAMANQKKKVERNRKN